MTDLEKLHSSVFVWCVDHCCPPSLVANKDCGQGRHHMLVTDDRPASCSTCFLNLPLSTYCLLSSITYLTGRARLPLKHRHLTLLPISRVGCLSQPSPVHGSTVTKVSSCCVSLRANVALSNQAPLKVASCKTIHSRQHYKYPTDRTV